MKIFGCIISLVFLGVGILAVPDGMIFKSAFMGGEPLVVFSTLSAGLIALLVLIANLKSEGILKGIFYTIGHFLCAVFFLFIVIGLFSKGRTSPQVGLLSKK